MEFKDKTEFKDKMEAKFKMEPMEVKFKMDQCKMEAQSKTEVHLESIKLMLVNCFIYEFLYLSLFFPL